MARSRSAAMPWLPVLHTSEEDIAFLATVLRQIEVVVAVDSADVPLGYCAVDRAAHVVDHLYVEPLQRRRGIGSALLNQVRQGSPQPLELWCFRDNTAARRFYESQDAQLVFATDGASNEERTPDVRLRLPVTGKV